MIRVRAGQVIGRNHIAQQANCQDAYAHTQQDGYIIGVVCDGCSEGTHSEVGATLAAQYLAQQAAQLLNTGHTPAQIPQLLYTHMLKMLDYLLLGLQPANPPHYILHHFLFTVVGVIASENGGVIFSAGDGITVVNDAVRKIDMNNRPPYPAYHLIEPHLFQEPLTLPQTFDVQPLPQDWERIIISTDGLELPLIPQVWNHTLHAKMLQHQLRAWSTQEKRFADDVTLITLERLADD